MRIKKSQPTLFLFLIFNPQLSNYEMNTDKIRNVLNILFLILALASIIVYIVARDDFKLFIYVCGAAIFVKLMEFFIRFTNR